MEITKEDCSGIRCLSSASENGGSNDDIDSDLHGMFTVCYPIPNKAEDTLYQGNYSEILTDCKEDQYDCTFISKMLSSVSLESITSGISSGSSASEERLSLLRCVASYNDTTNRKDFSNIDEGICDLDQSMSKENSETSQKAIGNKNKLRFEETVEKASEKCKSGNKGTKGSNSKNLVNSLKRRKSSKSGTCKDTGFDPTLEKSQTYLHGQSKNFSRANQYLAPARPGLRKLQVSYTQTNTENNQSVIFFDLVKHAHKRNILISETVSNLERRLLMRRSDPVRKTTFYEQMHVKDPRKALRKKIARTIAEKQKERKDRIKDTTDDMKMGYKPTVKTMKIFTAEDIEKMRDCRYLRVDTPVS